MNTSPSKPVACAVCGIQSDQHARWFLVVENAWLDRIKILSWHPVLAEQAEMRSVCGKSHLQILITHWLTYANLRFAKSRAPEFAVVGDASDAEPELPSGGRLVGELAVHRESFSRPWTGTPADRQSIFEALMGGLEANQTAVAEIGIQAAEYSVLEAIAVPDSAEVYFRQRVVQ